MKVTILKIHQKLMRFVDKQIISLMIQCHRF